jgi:hypothetical protein
LQQKLDQRQQVFEQTNVDNGLSVQQEPEYRAVAHVDGQSLYEMNEGRLGIVKVVMDVKSWSMTSRLNPSVTNRVNSRKMQREIISTA